jgi:hypothetical protein
MNESGTQSAVAAAADFTRTWRYKLGLFLIIIGNLGIVFSVLVLPFLGVGAGTIGSLVLGGEVVSLLSIVFLGKEGFKAIKNKIFGAVMASYVKPVSQGRHRLGITLLLLSMLNNYIMATYSWIAFEKTTPENPLPDILGLNFQAQGEMLFWVFLVGEALFLISIYVLGAEWWGCFRSIFVWSAPENKA